MSKAWIRLKTPEFARDVLRDFCDASHILEEQFQLFDHQGHLSFETLRDLLGREGNKGLLWRLKDTSHHLFRTQSQGRAVGRFLDWGLGYIFHETIKLREDAYQQMNYGPWFQSMLMEELSPEEQRIGGELYQVVLQTRQSMEREISRIRFIISHCLRLFPLYLQDQRHNMLLARYLFEQNVRVREVFGAQYGALVHQVYGQQPERMYVLASQCLRLGGWMDQAALAVEEAMKIDSTQASVLQEKEIVDNWTRKLSV